jgi:membrane associated rhomboid family serine protease
MPVAPAGQAAAQAAANQAAANQQAQQGGSTMAAPHQTIFAGAPATKLLTAVTLLSYLIIHSQKAHDLLQLDSAKLLNTHSNSGYRYWTSKLTFYSTGELITGGMLLLFLSRKMEREMGSRKFSVFYLLVSITAMAMELIMVHTDMLMLFSSSSAGSSKWQYAGPYAVLGALFWLFHKFTPRLHPRFFGVAGFYFSEKSFYYLWFLQVATAAKWHTVTAVAIGVVVGAIYTNAAPVAWLKLLDVPDVVASLCSKFGERVLLQAPPRMMVPSGGGNGGNGNPGGDLRQRPAGAAPAHPIFGHAPPPMQQGAQQIPAPAQQQRDFPPTPPPDEASIDQLVLMGFPRDKVVEALQNSHNDVNRAADRLLTQL